MSKLQISGVIPPMITPFTAGGDVDYDAHARNIDKWNETGLAGYLVLGSNSEAVYLTEPEKLKLIERTAKAAAPGKLIMAGTGMESTRETIHLTNRAAEAGARAALLVTPFYYIDKMNNAALISHFEEVADKVKIPILIYNVPKYTHLNVSHTVIHALSLHPNIIGMKDSSGNISQLVEFQQAAAEGFNILVGTASVWYPALTLGTRGSIMALANCAPAECVAVQELFQGGKTGAAQALYRRLHPVNNAVTNRFGVAGLKYACHLRGYEGGRVRSPLQELNEADKNAVRAILEEAGLLD